MNKNELNIEIIEKCIETIIENKTGWIEVWNKLEDFDFVGKSIFQNQILEKIKLNNEQELYLKDLYSNFK
tara:strand:- start:5371 stop:5580 length:210 start_codon:yes stop_codon:yes gene_type:complete